MSSSPPPVSLRSSLTAHSADLDKVPLTTVVAPAGSGKTTLISRWRDSLPDRLESVWLDVVAPHSDVATFSLDLLDAVRRYSRRFGEETQRVLANLVNSADDWRVVHRAFLRDWLSVSGEVILFLDNFHSVEAGSGTDQLVSEFLRALPQNLHLVIASRGTCLPL